MNESLAKYGLKYGPASIIAIYLVWFLVNTVSGQLEKIVDLTETSAIVQNDMLTVLKDIRDESYTPTASEIRQGPFRSVE